LKDLGTEVDINSTCKNIEISAKKSQGYNELKKHKGCSKLSYQSIQAKVQWLQDPSKINGDNLSTLRHEASRHSRNKRRDYLKDEINDLAINNKNKNIRHVYRGIHEFKRRYQPRSKALKNKNGDLLADSNNVSNK
jgi:hypothetical protein